MKCCLEDLQVEPQYSKRTIHSWISTRLSLTYAWRQAVSVLLQQLAHGKVRADVRIQSENPKGPSSGQKTDCTHITDSNAASIFLQGFPDLWPAVLHLSQAFSEAVTALPALAREAKERAPSLISCPRRWNFKSLSQILFLLLRLDPQYRKQDQYYYLGTMKRLHQSRVHPGMNDDLKNQRWEDFDRLVTFQLML